MGINGLGRGMGRVRFGLSMFLWLFSWGYWVGSCTLLGEIFQRSREECPGCLDDLEVFGAVAEVDLVILGILLHLIQDRKRIPLLLLKRGGDLGSGVEQPQEQLLDMLLEEQVIGSKSHSSITIEEVPGLVETVAAPSMHHDELAQAQVLRPGMRVQDLDQHHEDSLTMKLLDFISGISFGI